MLRLLVLATVLVSLTGACAPPPTVLSPEAQTKFVNTRVIRTLDLLRDTAVAANEQTPPLVSTETTRLILTVHRSAVVIIDASQTGWQTAVSTMLDELQRDKRIEPSELQLILPYLGLANAVLKEVN